MIKENSAAYGGGIYCQYSSLFITNTIIEGNKAEKPEKNGLGGGIVCNVSSFPTIINSLITKNSADYGSAMNCFEGAKPAIFYSTITDNYPGKSASLSAANDGKINIASSIVWGNGENQIAGPAEVEYSNVQGGFEGNGNIDSDPLFISGPWGDYYLSCQEAGQATDSPCIDSGKEDLIYGKPYEMTTRTDGIFDKSDVDMGYHYSPLIQFGLYKSPNKLKFKAGDSVEVPHGP